MILIAWVATAINWLVLGLYIWQPGFIMKYIAPRYYCSRCHKEITGTEKFKLDFHAGEDLENRKV